MRAVAQRFEHGQSCNVGGFDVDKRRRRPTFDELFNPLDAVESWGSIGGLSYQKVQRKTVERNVGSLTDCGLFQAIFFVSFAPFTSASKCLKVRRVAPIVRRCMGGIKIEAHDGESWVSTVCRGSTRVRRYAYVAS